MQRLRITLDIEIDESQITAVGKKTGVPMDTGDLMQKMIVTDPVGPNPFKTEIPREILDSDVFTGRVAVVCRSVRMGPIPDTDDPVLSQAVDVVRERLELNGELCYGIFGPELEHMIATEHPVVTELARKLADETKLGNVDNWARAADLILDRHFCETAG